jgi:phospholipid/cholesterol/gamma-HCH transport system substrate-binding protein
MTRSTGTLIKFTAFGLVMAVLTAFLFFIFGEVRTGATNGYSAVFADASRLETGDTVRVAGIRVGTVEDVSLQPDRKVLVKFDADRNVVLTTGTKAQIRYLNLVGDRYLELVDSPGSTKIMPVGSHIPVDRTAPALDLDLLLGGLKPVIQGLNPQDVNALTASLIQVLQGQGGTLESLFSKTSSFSNSLADLLGEARQPLAGTVDQLNRLAPLLDDSKDQLDASIQRTPELYRKLARVGAYGAFFPYYICGITFRASDLQGNTVVFPWIKQETGRCVEN